MDEVEEIKEFKKKIIYTYISMLKKFIFTWIVCLIFLVEIVSKFEKETSNIKLYITIFTASLFALFFVIALVITIPKWITYVIKKKTLSNKKVFDKTSVKYIVREIPEEYSPAICSCLYNNKVETYTDYTATLLNLEQKGYIKINCMDNKYSLDFINNNLDKLNLHEKYVIDCLKKKNNLLGQLFKTYVAKDMKKLGLIKLRKEILDIIMLLIALPLIYTPSYFLLEIIQYLLNRGLYIIAIVYIIMQITIVIVSVKFYYKKLRNYILLTKKGRKVKKEVAGFKAFLAQYTLMKDRDINHKELFGKYTAYAISLGEGDIINKFIEKNEQYRDLIYNKQGV